MQPDRIITGNRLATTAKQIQDKRGISFDDALIAAAVEFPELLSEYLRESESTKTIIPEASHTGEWMFGGHRQVQIVASTVGVTQLDATKYANQLADKAQRSDAISDCVDAAQAFLVAADAAEDAGLSNEAVICRRNGAAFLAAQAARDSQPRE
jgi:hypothetical protein